MHRLIDPIVVTHIINESSHTQASYPSEKSRGPPIVLKYHPADVPLLTSVARNLILPGSSQPSPVNFTRVLDVPLLDG